MLLHRDLHHDNILKHGNEWKVIDPKEVIGDPVYEVAAFIRNPMPELLTLDTTTHTQMFHLRMMKFAQILAFPAQRILDWCFVQAV